MDILRPTLVWIDGRCYRKCSDEHGKSGDSEVYEDNDKYEIDTDPSCTDEFHSFAEIEQQSNGRYKTTLSVANAYFGSIIGTKGSNKKRLESETKTQIIVPRIGVEGDIVILGQDKRGVSSARIRLEVIVDAARQRQPFTHFLSLPLNHSAMQHAFKDFRDDILRNCDGVRGIDASIFQKPEKLHLTIGTMPLLDNRERQKAADILSKCYEEIVKPLLQGEPLKVRVQGIEYMNDDPAEVDVLYAVVEPAEGSSTKLQLLADQLVDRFVHEGIMQRQYERVKLHATIMNTLFRKDNDGVTEIPTHHRGSKLRESFDAKQILEMFNNYFFAEFDIPCIHLSQRYSTASDGYYACSTKQLLP